MEKWINTVEVMLADLSREKEFNDWYDNIHLPDIMNTPGFLAARRYVIKEPRNGRGRYLTIYEIETDDIDKTMTVRREFRERERAQGHMSDVVIPNLVLPVWRDVLFRQISECSCGK